MSGFPKNGTGSWVSRNHRTCWTPCRSMRKYDSLRSFRINHMRIRSRLAAVFTLLVSVSMATLDASAQNQAVLPEVATKRLLNDLQVIVASGQHLGEGMTIGLVLRYGSAFDPADKGGLANLLTRMLGKAT